MTLFLCDPFFPGWLVVFEQGRLIEFGYDKGI